MDDAEREAILVQGSEEVSTYEHVALTRYPRGVLEVRLHSNQAPLIWGAGPHAELGLVFTELDADIRNRVIILTGTGNDFIRQIDSSWVGPMTSEKWSTIYFNGKRLLQQLVNIRCPVIGVINGPATVHAELALLSDIVLAADDAYISDAPHFRRGTVPGDGVHLIWPLLLGLNRARYFLLTGQRLSALEALELGVVNELHARSQLRARAVELALQLAQQADSTLRYAREAMTHQLRRLLLDGVGFGLALEGLGAYETWPTALPSAAGRSEPT